MAEMCCIANSGIQFLVGLSELSFAGHRNWLFLGTFDRVFSGESTAMQQVKSLRQEQLVYKESAISSTSVTCNEKESSR